MKYHLKINVQHVHSWSLAILAFVLCKLFILDHLGPYLDTYLSGLTNIPLRHQSHHSLILLITSQCLLQFTRTIQLSQFKRCRGSELLVQLGLHCHTKGVGMVMHIMIPSTILLPRVMSWAWLAITHHHLHSLTILPIKQTKTYHKPC